MSAFSQCRILSDVEIDYAISINIPSDVALHEHRDCIRIAYGWLDAQKKRANINRISTFPLKHIIESWGKRYVSQADVEVAASLHPHIKGSYPYYNISASLIKPSEGRLINIGEAGKHQDYVRYDDSEFYRYSE
ncbi:hypothetical protein [uncultured Sulfitobacter sp.]|uniref:hypothetical protein n=1 Tax=uncultured Sulfitobacter sp. TaxID=191468 RepID=UPI00260F4446|nr:hypothetical protein [uncultured Sulfitobacter sp.]